MPGYVDKKILGCRENVLSTSNIKEYIDYKLVKTTLISMTSLLLKNIVRVFVVGRFRPFHAIREFTSLKYRKPNQTSYVYRFQTKVKYFSS